MNYLAVLTQNSFGSESDITQADRDAAAYFRANQASPRFGVRDWLSLLFPPKQDRQFMRAMTRPQPKQRSSAPAPGGVAVAPSLSHASPWPLRIGLALAPVAVGAVVGHESPGGTARGALTGLGVTAGGFAGRWAGLTLAESQNDGNIDGAFAKIVLLGVGGMVAGGVAAWKVQA